jgi:hypothetical protein
MEVFGLDPCAAAAIPVLSDHWTLTPICCTGLVAQKFGFAKLKPLSVVPHHQMVLLQRRPVHILNLLTPSFLPPPSAIRLNLNDALWSLSSSDDQCIVPHGYVIYMMLF